MRMLNWIMAALACALSWAACAQTNPINVTTNTKVSTGTTVITGTNVLRTSRPEKKPYPLAFDSEVKDYSTTNAGELTCHFTFNVTNTASTNVIITGTMSSCGCTVAEMPSDPWVLQPGTNGQLQITVNIAGKYGILNKQVMLIGSNLPPKILTLRLSLPTPEEMTEEERARNMDLAKADSQAIFKGSCATCHVAPTRGRMGADLYMTMCGVCHESPRRASMVPNLHTLKKPTDFDFWKKTITYGVTNSAMPGFSVSQGGPLSDARIDSIADYLNVYISRNRPRRPAGDPSPAPNAIKVESVKPASTNATNKPL